jgi:hypothetical protein
MTGNHHAHLPPRARGEGGAHNIPVVPKAERLTLGEAAALIRQDYAANGHKSADTLEHRLTRVLATFRETTRLGRLTMGAVEANKAARPGRRPSSGPPSSVARATAKVQPKSGRGGAGTPRRARAKCASGLRGDGGQGEN